MKHRRIIEAAAAFAGIIVAVAWLSGWFESKIAPGTVEKPDPSQIAQSSKVTVERISEPVVEWASGTVESAKRTTIASRIVARIEQMNVSAGDQVAQGDVLIELDARELKARLEQANDTLQAAMARLDLARSEFARSEELLKSGVTTAQKHEQAISSQRVAQADVERAGQTVEEARASLSHTVIRAPAAGRVIERLAEPGDTVTPGISLLRLYDPAVLRVEAPVRESLAVNLSVGDTLEIDLSSLGTTQQGKIDEIVPYAEPGARTLLVKVGLQSSTQGLAGMFARIGIPAGKRDGLIIPQTAVRRIGQLEFAYVLDDGHIEQRMITTGQSKDGSRIDVLSGLKQDETIITPWSHAAN